MNTKGNRWQIPLAAAVTHHADSKPVSFHVPGHKFAQSIQKLASDLPRVWSAMHAAMSIDVTELSDTDDLHAPAGAIAEAQRLAADSFGAERTYFLVGGSTAGNLALLLACCEPGDVIIVQRNVHKSVLNGLALAGAQTVFVTPRRDESTQLDVVPELADIEEALTRYPEAKAVFLTNPSYYGFCVDLAPYAEFVHNRHKLLLVDEAHGAHFGRHPRFPRSAVHAGADAVVQSTHKTLTALTMGAMLHIQGNRLDHQAVKRALSMIQSSSPSYPIMISLDIARAMVDYYGPALFEKGIETADRLRHAIKHSERFKLVESCDRLIRTDPLRIVFMDRTGLLSGYEILSALERKGCWAEMADAEHVVLVVGMESGDEDATRLLAALNEIAEESRGSSKPAFEREKASLLWNGSRISEPIRMSRNKYAEHEIETVELGRAAGRISADLVIPYPPGIPILFPGEEISPELVSYVEALRSLAAKCQGTADPSLQTLAVLRIR
ncbi:aminotransferase class I/II-fold pyridoxal phosphate-dependent enzyme [Paenibacillus humicola]|uniref:aminotransferase class I/II-fold pyridoxal phosphate-dependent enzyme n=1 Tax=Paenibacillus humicola TaxID=3110540 RepID=UPI00237BD756|nr:aminotransferase class I/II-fold pyridoxal phosphate-dependent enzyme [Paenibacillus humicola]